jgi:predicted nicotinamide N-methyase
MFYEESTASPLLSLLQYHRRQGAEVLIADGNRPFTPRKQLTLLETATFMVNKAVEGKTERTTTLYRLTGTGT